MKTNLEILINELQTECDYVQKEINLCVEDSDFEGAQIFQKSLNYNQRQLRILKNIQNPNWSKMAGLERSIELLKRKENDYAIKQIANYQAELDELKAKNNQQRHALDGEEIEFSLEALLKGKIRKINLQIGVIVEIHLELNNKILHIKLIINSNIEKRRYLVPKNLGLEVCKDNKSMKVPDFESSKISHVIEVLARIIYEVLGLSGNENAKIIIS